jgi:predicted MFS family arabinose efflux permease
MAAPLWFLTVETPLPLVVAVMFVFGLGGPLGVAPISAILTTRAPGDIRPQVVAAFLAVTSAGTPAGAAGAGYAIQLIGFRATYVGIAVAMTAAFALLVWCVRRVRSAPDAVPAAAPTL